MDDFIAAGGAKDIVRRSAQMDGSWGGKGDSRRPRTRIGRTGTMTSPPDASEPKQRILIVDDKQENLVALCRVLGDLDAEVVQATNGNDALAATLHNDFALAMLDIQMPGMDGYELAALLRGDEHTQNLPIIFITAAYCDEAQVFRGYEAGTVDYIIKPYQARVLISRRSIFSSNFTGQILRSPGAWLLRRRRMRNVSPCLNASCSTWRAWPRSPGQRPASPRPNLAAVHCANMIPRCSRNT
ncbi:MAG: response regulator [Chloroflexi bacterium]|nr:response regulator [Chloroflexota bacterium]